MSQINIYALYEDLQIILESLESKIDIKYAEFNQFDSKLGCIYDSYKDIPYLSGDENGPQYLILKKETPLIGRFIEGSSKYAFDQLLNPDSIVLKPGVTINKDFIISGNVGSASVNDSEISKALFKAAQKIIKAHFKRVAAYWIGNGAYQVLLNGGRLGISTQTPPLFDLKIDQV
ncbi:MAG: hypothetical protein AAGC78_04115 [Cellvibrio sp.]|uniref:hypothetical protein n=1 Tax=Cellvibrio sp. TaxID=1965322 RepID=UPI0031AF938A